MCKVTMRRIQYLYKVSHPNSYVIENLSNTKEDKGKGGKMGEKTRS